MSYEGKRIEFIRSSIFLVISCFDMPAKDLTQLDYGGELGPEPCANIVRTREVCPRERGCPVICHRVLAYGCFTALPQPIFLRQAYALN